MRDQILNTIRLIANLGGNTLIIREPVPDIEVLMGLARHGISYLYLNEDNGVKLTWRCE